MKIEEIEEKVEEMKEAKIILKNIQEGGKIERFKFTEKENLALDFLLDILDANINEILEASSSK